jgi:hypothetical protein
MADKGKGHFGQGGLRAIGTAVTSGRKLNSSVASFCRAK